LKSQELTAIFLATRLYCSVVMEYDIHTILDLCTFATTGWVIYMMRFKLKATLMTDLDNLKLYYVVSRRSALHDAPPSLGPVRALCYWTARQD
jgi:ER lumen protein retaining receptor